MTDEEIKKLAAEIVSQKGGFHVDPEDHYLQHQRLDRLLDIFDTTSNVLWKGFVGAVVLGMIVFAAIGLGISK